MKKEVALFGLWLYLILPFGSGLYASSYHIQTYPGHDVGVVVTDSFIADDGVKERAIEEFLLFSEPQLDSEKRTEVFPFYVFEKQIILITLSPAFKPCSEFLFQNRKAWASRFLYPFHFFW